MRRGVRAGAAACRLVLSVATGCGQRRSNGFVGRGAECIGGRPGKGLVASAQRHPGERSQLRLHRPSPVGWRSGERCARSTHAQRPNCAIKPACESDLSRDTPARSCGLASDCCPRAGPALSQKQSSRTDALRLPPPTARRPSAVLSPRAGRLRRAWLPRKAGTATRPKASARGSGDQAGFRPYSRRRCALFCHRRRKAGSEWPGFGSARQAPAPRPH